MSATVFINISYMEYFITHLKIYTLLIELFFFFVVKNKLVYQPRNYMRLVYKYEFCSYSYNFIMKEVDIEFSLVFKVREDSQICINIKFYGIGETEVHGVIPRAE